MARQSLCLSGLLISDYESCGVAFGKEKVARLSFFNTGLQMPQVPGREVVQKSH
jgi:hypothetical protein